MNINEILKIAVIIIQTCTFIVLFIGLLYTARQIKLLRQSHRQNQDWNRRNAAQELTLEFALTFDTSEINEKLNYANATAPYVVDGLLKIFESEPKLQSKCHKLLNFYEIIAIGYANGIYDKRVIEDTYKSIMKHTFNVFELYIKHRQQTFALDSYAILENVVNEWNKKDKSLKQRPFVDEE